ncbi:MAG: DNA polymerase III subunit beta [Christensenellales bacterium]|jgi:DNA polymerase-3 subunit beta
MKFSIDKESLISAISIVQKAMGTRSTMPVLEGIYIEAENGRLSLKCTDMALLIESSVEAEVEENGVVVLPGRIFSEIIRKLPSGKVSVLSAGDMSVKIKSGMSRTTLQCMNVREFPEMPEIEKKSGLVMEQKIIRDMIRQTIFATASDETKPILTGTLIEMEGGCVNFVALDGYRLAFRSSKADGGDVSVNCVVPAKSMGEIAKTLGEEGEAAITIGTNHILIDAGKTKIISRLLDGEFIKYRQIMPQDYQTRVKIARAEFAEAMDRASLMAREGKNNLVKLSIDEDKMVITSNSEIGDAYEEVDIWIEGKPLEIAFNSKYFSDVLKALEDETVYLDFNSNVSPCVLRPVEGSAFQYLILPVRIYAG